MNAHAYAGVLVPVCNPAEADEDTVRRGQLDNSLADLYVRMLDTLGLEPRSRLRRLLLA